MNRPPARGLLAPVPLEHLQDGLGVCRAEGKVAFGTRVWETFRDLELEAGIGCPVLIYASHSPVHLGPVVSWTARFVRWVAAVGGAHPDGDLYRPPSTQAGDEDLSGDWLGFWEVSDLSQLKEAEQVPIAELHDRQGRRYRRGFVPEGPVLVSGTGSARITGAQ